MNLKLRLVLFVQNYIEPKQDFERLTAAQFRAANELQRKKITSFVELPPEEMISVQDKKVEMRDGASIPVRIYKPSDKEHLPVFIYFHGGGFATRSIDSHDRLCRRLAKHNDMLVVNVGYRLAPEYKFPIPHQDCYDATVWIAENTASLGGNPAKIVVGGDSAGGNLATVVCLLARDNNGPNIAAQVLIYPVTDARMGFPSIDKFAKGYFLTKRMMQWFVDAYCGQPEDILNPLMSPYLMEDLSNLPPAYVSTAEYDPLKDEGAAYAKRLRAANNEVFYKDYKGVIHGFMSIPKITPKETRQANEDIRAFLKEIVLNERG